MKNKTIIDQIIDSLIQAAKKNRDPFIGEFDSAIYNLFKNIKNKGIK